MNQTTTTQLLDALAGSSGDGAWGEIDGRYRPILAAVARRAGLTADDAEDVAQETLAHFARSFRDGRYERGRGRLRTWILGICRNRIIDQQRARGRRREYRGESAIVDVIDEAALTRLWDEESHRAVFARALDRLRVETGTTDRVYAAFECVALRNVPAAMVAAEFDMTEAEVYRIKHRVTKRLRALVAEMAEVFDTDA